MKRILCRVAYAAVCVALVIGGLSAVARPSEAKVGISIQIVPPGYYVPYYAPPPYPPPYYYPGPQYGPYPYGPYYRPHPYGPYYRYYHAPYHVPYYERHYYR